MKAFLKNYRQSPRKVRLVADLIKNKRIVDAFTELKSLAKRAAEPMEKLLASAVSNAKQAGISDKDLYVANVTVNEGIVMKRSMPRARGSASRINKRTSHIMLTLIEKPTEKAEKKVSKKEITPKKLLKESKVASSATRQEGRKSKSTKKPEVKA